MNTTTTKIIKCQRCNKRLRRNADGWNVQFDKGRIVAHLCPDCQTSDEYLEAAINEATIDYSETMLGVGEEGVRDCLESAGLDADDYDTEGLMQMLNEHINEARESGLPLNSPEAMGRYAAGVLSDHFHNYRR